MTKWAGIDRRKDSEETNGYAEKIARLEERLQASQDSLKLAREQMDKRLEGMNEFRLQLNNQAATFITRKEHEFLIKDIQELKQWGARLDGKASQQSVMVAYVISIVGIIGSFLMRLFK